MSFPDAIFGPQDKDCWYCGKTHSDICDEQMYVAAQRNREWPDMDAIRLQMMSSLTTQPSYTQMSIVYMWMQVDPDKWAGYHNTEAAHTSVAMKEKMIHGSL